MRLRIPFLTTDFEHDVLLVFALTPLWWVTGFNIVIYHTVSLLVFFKMMIFVIKNNQPLRLSTPLLWFFAFLISYLASILINIPLRSAQRVMASFNNYSVLVMAFLIMVSLFNTDGRSYLKNFIKWGGRLCILTSILGAVFLLLWLAGYQSFQFNTLVYKFFPKLINFPYFTMLLVVTGTVPDYFDIDLPRVTIYSGVATSTGGVMLSLIPLMMAYYEIQRRRTPVYWAMWFISLIVLLFTFARAAVIALIGAYVVVTLLSKGKKVAMALVALAGTTLISGWGYRLVEWVLNVRQSSTVGRMNLYRDALRILMEENPLMGLGVRLRDGFTMMAIGSHSLFIEVVFVSGFIGFFLFLMFQFLIIREWFFQRKYLKNDTEKTIWKYLGMGLISMDVWLISDTIFGPPFTPYVYFMITAGILLFGKVVREKGITEPLYQDRGRETANLSARL